MPKKIYDNSGISIVENISGYLIDSENIYALDRSHPICDVSEIGIGNLPIDDGNYLFSKEEMFEFIKKEPMAEKYFRKWYGAREFLNGIPRYCLWLGDCTPNELRKMPECLKRIKNVRQFRLSSDRKATNRIADKPTRFWTENMPNTDYLLIPRVSSEKRKYIPIGYMSCECLASDACLILPEASLYELGIITSSVHMAWIRTVCGRLKSDYRYSVGVVYNNFPWPSIVEKQRIKLEETAQAILDTRALFVDSSLADLYDERTMPQELRNAHKKNDIAVLEAYGFDKDIQEAECVCKLMKLYQQYTN